MINLYEVFNKWEDGSGNFECYFKSTPFTTLKGYIADMDIEDKHISMINFDNLDKMSEEGILGQENTLYIIDLPSNESIEYAIILNNTLGIKPILAYNHIFNKFGIVGDRELANKLISYSGKLKNNSVNNGYAFILDYNRYIDDVDLTNPLLYNNQYEVTEEDLPHAGILKEQRINNIVYIAQDTEKEDIKDYLNYLGLEGLKIEIVLLKERV